MLQLITAKATSDQIKSAADDFDGYIKFVVDIDKMAMTIGGLRHVDGEKILLENGSLQKNLWGGGYDNETKDIDFDSMINIRPADNNFSRTVGSRKVQTKIEQIVRNLLE